VLANDLFFKRRETRIIKVWKGKRKWMTYVEMNFRDDVEVSFKCHEIWGTFNISTVLGAFDTSGRRRIDIQSTMGLEI
jgi:hypothetical protein